MNTTLQRAARLFAVTAASAGLVLLGAGGASAHVTVNPDATTAGSYSVLTFSFGHGCEGSGTTRIAIQVPEELVTVTPTIHPGWTVDKVMETLPAPVDNGYGGQYTERVAEVVYTADSPVADGYRQALEVQAHLPEQAGGTLYFPVVQTCEVGETAWVQIAEEGQDPEELESPAPSLTITAAAAESASEPEPGTAVTASDVSEDAGSRATLTSAAPAGATAPAAVTWVALALATAGLGLGAAALARSRARV